MADFALLDTAAEWCVLSADIATAFESGEDFDRSSRLETRLGTFYGRLERIPVRFPNREGEPLTIEATWFVCPDWPGPLVLGWKGCLERFRFALDPTEELFYFAP